MSLSRLGPDALWTTAKFPQKDWTLDYVEDIGHREHKCECCDYQTCRYVAHCSHPLWDDIRIGRTCAEHLTGDSKRYAAALNAHKRKKAAQKQREERLGSFRSVGQDEFVWCQNPTVKVFKAQWGWKTSINPKMTFGQAFNAKRYVLTQHGHELSDWTRIN